MDDFTSAFLDAAPLDRRDLVCAVVGDALGEDGAIGPGDLDRVADREGPAMSNNSGRQKALPAADQRFLSADVDDDGTTRVLDEFDPKLAAASANAVRREERADLFALKDPAQDRVGARVRDDDAGAARARDAHGLDLRRHAARSQRRAGLPRAQPVERAQAVDVRQQLRSMTLRIRR